MAEKMLNINLDRGQRKKFTIDGDESRILELNTSDMGIFARLDAFDKNVTAALQEFDKIQTSETEKDGWDIIKLGEQLHKLDEIIKEQFDILYDTNFSEVVVPHGTMLDLIDGEFRFQYLNEVFANLYEKQLSKELKIRNDTIRKHTKKYIEKVENVNRE